MRDDFERELARTLQQHDEIPRTDLVGASLQRARRIRRRRQAAAGALAVALVAGAGSTALLRQQHSHTEAAARPSTAPSIATSAPASSLAPLPTAVPTATAPPGPEAASAVPSTTTSSRPAASPLPTSSAVPACSPDTSSWTIVPDTATAQEQTYQVTITVTSGRCRVAGFPQVRLVDAANLTIGAEADPSGAGAGEVEVSPGHPARAPLVHAVAGTTQAGCRRVAATGFLVVPPNSAVSIVLPMTVPACANASVHLLRVESFR